MATKVISSNLRNQNSTNSAKQWTRSQLAMGNMLSQLWGRLSRLGRNDIQFKIIIVGMNNAGKTTILYKLALDEVIVTEPTIGSNVEEVSHKNLKL